MSGFIMRSRLRTSDAGVAELVAIVTGDALTSTFNTLGMRNVVGAETAVYCTRTVRTDRLL